MAVETEAREELSFAAIDAIAHKHNIEPGAAIPILQEVQDTYGYIPLVAIQRIADNMNIPDSELFGIVTFYAQFRFQPPGKNIIKVCHGTACHLSAAERISQALSREVGAKEGETSPDGQFTVERVACLGCCSLAPCMMVNGEVNGRLTPEDIRKIVSQVRETEVVAASE
jgi:NADH-quinone oxidoreductase subunit E